MFLRLFLSVQVLLVLSGCITSSKTTNGPEVNEIAGNISAPEITDSDGAPAVSGTEQTPVPGRLLPITRIQQTGSLNSTELIEVSGMTASIKNPGVLFAINDSGNSPKLYGFSETGNLLGSWRIDAKNRDWEDMASVIIAGVPYLIIGDTGDNLNIHAQSALLLVAEPDISNHKISEPETLTPQQTIRFTFDDGPRNVEAFAVSDNSVYLISKEPIKNKTPVPGGIYKMDLPDSLNDDPLVAARVGVVPLQPRSLESRLAAAIAGVDLNQVTAMDFDNSADTAYLLTYRHVLKIEKNTGQSWAQALTQTSDRIHTHDLGQAEALAVSPGRAIWITSERRQAPLWALPVISNVSN